MRTPEQDPRYARLAAKARSRGARPKTRRERRRRCPIEPRASRRSSARSAPADAAASRRGSAWGVAAAAAVVLLRGRLAQPAIRRAPPRRRGPSRARRAHRHASSPSPTSKVRARRSRRRGGAPAAAVAIGSPPEPPFASRAPVTSCSRSTPAPGCASAPRRASRLTALGATQRFDVESGSLEADVAKVPLGGRFIVATGDAEVEVKGTRFEVAVVPAPSACAPFARTQVMVHEGVVVVRFAGGEARLPAGSVWPACPAAAGRRPFAALTAGRRSPTRPPRCPIAAGARRPAVGSRRRWRSRTICSRRRSRRDAAVTSTKPMHWLDRLIARYPKGR